MPVSRYLLQDMAHPGLGAHHGVRCDPEQLGKHISSLKPYPVDIKRQPVRIFSYFVYRIVAIGLIYPYRAG